MYICRFILRVICLHKNKQDKLSRPRRFGKSFAAQMLCAYYDKTCDSAGLFDDLEIAGDIRYRDYRNRYDVEDFTRHSAVFEQGAQKFQISSLQVRVPHRFPI